MKELSITDHYYDEDAYLHIVDSSGTKWVITTLDVLDRALQVRWDASARNFLEYERTLWSRSRPLGEPFEKW